MGLYDQWKEEEPSGYESAATFGFTVCEVLDNKKCSYFHDYESSEVWTGSGETLCSGWNSTVASGVTFPDTPSGVTIADESQANGIINIKKLVINFGVGNNIHLKNYIQNVVLKYLEQMIPSTAILEYRFNNESAFDTNGSNLSSGSFSFIRTAHAAITKDDPTITVWRQYPTPINEM